MINNNESAKAATSQPEPWLRGTKQEVPAVLRAVLHALELAQEDLQRWCHDFTDAELQTSPLGLPPLAFHLRHIPRSMDRLLTYAEGRALSSQQLAELKSESDASATASELFAGVAASFATAEKRILALASADYESARTVGKKALPTTVGGLLVHIADHTQRHVGQAIITAKLLTAMRERQEHSPDPR
jgi:DinB superfamily